MPLKRFLLFKGQYYDAAGGWNDFIDCYDTLEEAKAGAGVVTENEWAHIVDVQTGDVHMLEMNEVEL